MIVIDTETGGLDPWRNPVLSVGVVDFETGEDWSTRIIPAGHLSIDSEAARINGYDPETWGGLPESTAAKLFQGFVRGKDEIVCGANIRFDVDFLSAWLVRCGQRKPFWPRLVDVQSLALNAHTQGKITLPRKDNGQLSFSVTAICQALEIKRGETHDALADALDTVECIRRINRL
jgi:DNA polymerase III epsilon subunit-like protein